MFFSNKGIVKELLYSEFEALLEGFTPEKEWAGKDAHAVYLELSPDLHIKAAVFFLIGFDGDGWVEASWNMPLVNLARTAKPHEQLTSGLRVATSSNCSEAKYQEMLWDPYKSDGAKVFTWINNAIAINKLGFSRQAPKAEPDSTDLPTANSPMSMSAAMEAQFSQLLQNQMSGATGVAQVMAQLDQVKAEYEQKLEALQGDLANKVRQFDSAKAQLEELQSTLKVSERKLAEVRECYELRLENSKGAKADYINALREHYETEANEQIASAQSEYKELLNWREVELIYRAERESTLYEEIAKLKRINMALEQANNPDLLQVMSDKGINFVTYQVGLGHISIPVSEMNVYLENPIGFMAAYCNVTQALYLDWLAHFHAPVCRIQNASGNYCGASVERIGSPEHFMAGVSDCCKAHQHKA